ncbi:hypothetical protein FRC10_001054, partial [Ceratobasidium sp. 414]
NNVASTTQGGCPKCMQLWKGRGQGGPIAPLCDQDETLEALRAYHQTKDKTGLEKLHLLPVLPFWSDIPYVNIRRSMVHQLYKGMFEHAGDWVEDLLGTEEFNRRFQAMPAAQDLRHFKKGVMKVKIWVGRESRDMMRQFLPVVIDAQAPPRFIQLIRALLDFSYLAHAAQLTDTVLQEMERVLAAFHKAKYVLLAEQTHVVANVGGFNRMPKLHMLSHYMHDIRKFVGIQDMREVDIGDDKEDKTEDNSEDCDEGTTSGDEDEDKDAVKVGSVKSAESEIHYPRPTISTARRLTVLQVPAHMITSSYSASEFIQALRHFLSAKTTPKPGEKLILLPSDRFNVWHKVVLKHAPLPFAPVQPCQPQEKPEVQETQAKQNMVGKQIYIEADIIQRGY